MKSINSEMTIHHAAEVMKAVANPDCGPGFVRSRFCNLGFFIGIDQDALFKVVHPETSTPKGPSKIRIDGPDVDTVCSDNIVAALNEFSIRYLGERHDRNGSGESVHALDWAVAQLLCDYEGQVAALRKMVESTLPYEPGVDDAGIGVPTIDFG